MSGMLVSPSSAFYSLPSKTSIQSNPSRYNYPLVSLKPRISLLLEDVLGSKLGLRVGSPRKDFVVRSTTDDSSSSDRDSSNILDAFFLGKALAEALNERMESAVGELSSTVSKLQSEQQKQIKEFQADVLDRAKKAKQNAAKDTSGAQELTSTSTTADTSSADSTTSDSSSSADTTNTASASSDETTTSTTETS